MDINELLGKQRMSDDDFERERVVRQKEQAQKKKDFETEEAVRQALEQLSPESTNNLLGNNSAEDLTMSSLRKNPLADITDEESEENAILNALIGQQSSGGAPGLQRSPSLDSLGQQQGFAF